MSRHGTNETVGFNNLNSGYEGNYYGMMSGHQGYGGFNYAEDILFMNRSTWTQPDGVGYSYGWCDTGFQNACEGKVEAWIYKTGLMEAAKLTETFTLKSMIVASAWDTEAKWQINSYTYGGGKLKLKASDVLTISQTAQRIDFAKLGGRSDFKNISAVSFVLLDVGKYGNTCSSYLPTYGYQMAFDNLKVHWNGKIPDPRPASGSDPRLHAHHVIATPLAALQQHASASDDHLPGGHSSTSGADCTAWHSELTSLDAALGHDGAGGLAERFVLPQPEHFGT